MLPKILKNFNLFLDGVGMAGICEEVTLPSLERATEEYRGGGMLGPVSLDLGMEALQIDFTLVEFFDDVIKKWAEPAADGVLVRFMGARKDEGGDGKTDSIEIEVRGRWKKVEPGGVKNGDLAKMKVEMPLTYMKYSVNSDVLVEIDLVNGKEIVGGNDRSADVMAAIGQTAG